MSGSLRYCCQLSTTTQLCWFGHVSRSNTFAKHIQQGKIEGANILEAFGSSVLKRSHHNIYFAYTINSELMVL